MLKFFVYLNLYVYNMYQHVNTSYSKQAFSVFQKINILISQSKHMLWALKRTVSMRHFFWAPKTYAKNYG